MRAQDVDFREGEHGHKIGFGKKYVTGGCTYILAQTARKQMALIAMTDGNRWRDPVPVERIDYLSKAEAEAIFGPLSDWQIG